MRDEPLRSRYLESDDDTAIGSGTREKEGAASPSE
jgi:hypothetical protein